MIIAVLMVAVGGSIYLTVTSQRDSFLEETSRSLSVMSTILNDVVRNTMLVGEAPIAVRTMSELEEIGDFEEIRIYRRDGTSAFHDDSTISAVNQYLGREAFEVTERVPFVTIENADFTRVIETKVPRLVESVDNRTAEYYFPILNYAECRACHGTANFIRGVAYFRVSTEHIFSKLDQTRNTLTAFFVVAGVLIAFLIIYVLRRIVLRPVLLIGRTVTEVGQGNLETSVTVETGDELGELATEINGMIVGLKEKSRLEVENRVIEAKNEENRKYLDNINEGLLLIDADQRISEQYSTFLEELFGTDRIAGRRFSEFIHPQLDADSPARSEIDQFVDLIFTSTTTDMEMIASINPLADKRLSVARQGGVREIVIDASFQRIMDAGAVQNVMVIFVDKTELARAEQALETERLRSETEIEQIAAILRSGPESFMEFAGDAERTLRLLDDNVDLSGGSSEIAELFREVHSLKGAARYMELKSFASSLNAVEEIIASVRDGARKAGSGTTGVLSGRLAELHDGVASIKRINDRFKEFASHDAGRGTGARSVRPFLDNLQRMVAGLAEELGKNVAVRTATDFEALDSLPVLRNAIIHLVRNAIDHGLEEGLERISVGKSEQGTLRIAFTREADNRCRVDVQDDGRGIDFDAVRRRAAETGVAVGESPSSNELLKVLFSPRFSSRDQATEISGRGVGLDAVQAVVKSLGGSISVATKTGTGTRFTLRVPVGGGVG